MNRDGLSTEKTRRAACCEVATTSTAAAAAPEDFSEALPVPSSAVIADPEDVVESASSDEGGCLRRPLRLFGFVSFGLAVAASIVVFDGSIEGSQ
jgi:hypothetical protein